MSAAEGGVFDAVLCEFLDRPRYSALNCDEGPGFRPSISVSRPCTQSVLLKGNDFGAHTALNETLILNETLLQCDHLFVVSHKAVR